MADVNGKTVASRIELAKKIGLQQCNCPENQFNHVSLLYRGSAFINYGINTYEFSSIAHRFGKPNKRFFNTRHSEVHCISGISKSVTQGADVFNIRLNKKGELRLARPCSSCVLILRHMGIRNVYYSTNENTVERLRL